MILNKKLVLFNSIYFNEKVLIYNINHLKFFLKDEIKKKRILKIDAFEYQHCDEVIILGIIKINIKISKKKT